MNDQEPAYRVKIKYRGKPPKETYAWEIYRNADVLPVLRSQEPFGSRKAGLADANRARAQLVDSENRNEASRG